MSDPTAQRTVLRLAAAAYRAGASAAEGSEPRRNPFDGASSSAVERVQARMWARGFSARNPFRDA